MLRNNNYKSDVINILTVLWITVQANQPKEEEEPKEEIEEPEEETEKGWKCSALSNPTPFSGKREDY